MIAIKNKHAVDFSFLLNASDYVVLLINYDETNKNFIGSTAFNKMKKNAYFINTSRGELVNEEDLLRALISGKLKGAALDVLNGDSAWAGEVDGDNKLIEYASIHSNLIITPHMGGYGKDSIGRTRQFLTEKLLSKI